MEPSIYSAQFNLFSLPLLYLAGILVSFTPCVYPLIPVTITIIGSREAATKTRAFLLSLLYVTGIAITYSILGAFASLTGKIFGVITQRPLVYFIAGNIFILLGMNLLDVFQIKMPAFLQSVSPQKKSKGLFSIFLIGLASGLVVGPCTAPALGAILTYVATKQNVILGFLMLFFFALGMGTLLIIVGTFSNVIMPKSGQWLVRTKKVMGGMLILIGEFFLIRGGMLWI